LSFAYIHTPIRDSLLPFIRIGILDDRVQPPENSEMALDRSFLVNGVLAMHGQQCCSTDAHNAQLTALAPEPDGSPIKR